jgi:hypothetical protein
MQHELNRRNLPATGGHTDTICLRLAANYFFTVWQPVAQLPTYIKSQDLKPINPLVNSLCGEQSCSIANEQETLAGGGNDLELKSVIINIKNLPGIEHACPAISD